MKRIYSMQQWPRLSHIAESPDVSRHSRQSPTVLNTAGVTRLGDLQCIMKHLSSALWVRDRCRLTQPISQPDAKASIQLGQLLACRIARLSKSSVPVAQQSPIGTRFRVP